MDIEAEFQHYLGITMDEYYGDREKVVSNLDNGTFDLLCEDNRRCKYTACVMVAIAMRFGAKISDNILGEVKGM